MQGAPEAPDIPRIVRREFRRRPFAGDPAERLAARSLFLLCSRFCEPAVLQETELRMKLRASHY